MDAELGPRGTLVQQHDSVAKTEHSSGVEEGIGDAAARRLSKVARNGVVWMVVTGRGDQELPRLAPRADELEKRRRHCIRGFQLRIVADLRQFNDICVRH